GELEACVDKLFDEGGSSEQAKQGHSASGEQGVSIQLVSEGGKSQSAIQRLLAEAVRNAEVRGGKSQSAIQRLLAEAVRNAEVRGEAIHSFPFVTSSVSATPEREAGGTDPAMGGFTDLTGSDLLVGGIHTIIIPDTDLQNVYMPQWSVTKESRLDDGHRYECVLSITLGKEREAAKAIGLHSEASKFETVEKSLQSEVEAFKERNNTLGNEKSEL
nr:hypothetical protein [Tanacetum cinerariifolium]